MKPKDFGWREDQHVTVTNPTPEDFRFQVHSKEYVVGAGQTAKMPGYIAWVYVHKIATKMAQDSGEFNRWNEEGFRQTYYNKVVVGAENIVQLVEPEPVVEAFTQAPQTNEPAQESEPSKIEPMKPEVKRGRPAKN